MFRQLIYRNKIPKDKKKNEIACTIRLRRGEQEYGLLAADANLFRKIIYRFSICRGFIDDSYELC
jgi:hypothetical protein